MKLILASQSPNRKRLLKKAGFPFEVFVPDIPEKDFMDSKNPESSCLHISREKALKAQKSHPSAVIIACDQMAYLEGKLFGKALTTEKAIEQLTELQGKTHSLLTGLCMLWKEKSFSYLCKSQMSMRTLSPKQIENYIHEEPALKSAGSYHIEEKGIKLFEKIQTEDFNSIEGLPLIQVINQLIKWDYPLFAEVCNRT